MELPTQSPDLNPTELLWEQVDRMVRKKGPSSQLVGSASGNMGGNLQAVIAANGGLLDESKV